MKKKVIILIGIFMLIVLGVCYMYRPYNKEIELTYLGTAIGECSSYIHGDIGETNPKAWEEKEYVYHSCQSYTSFTAEKFKEIYEKEKGRFDFEPNITSKHRYICAYGYPLIKLEYDERYVVYREAFANRAKIDSRNYKENVWFIYEIEDINIGSMAVDGW